MYLEMIFGKNKEQTMRRLQFKFDPFPTKSTTICLFHQRWIKKNQKIGKPSHCGIICDQDSGKNNKIVLR